MVAATNSLKVSEPVPRTSAVVKSVRISDCDVAAAATADECMGDVVAVVAVVVAVAAVVDDGVRSAVIKLGRVMIAFLSVSIK